MYAHIWVPVRYIPLCCWWIVIKYYLCRRRDVRNAQHVNRAFPMHTSDRRRTVAAWRAGLLCREWSFLITVWTLNSLWIMICNWTQHKSDTVSLSILRLRPNATVMCVCLFICWVVYICVFTELALCRCVCVCVWCMCDMRPCRQSLMWKGIHKHIHITSHTQLCVSCEA